MREILGATGFLIKFLVIGIEHSMNFKLFFLFGVQTTIQFYGNVEREIQQNLE